MYKTRSETNQEVVSNGTTALCAAILIQAIIDYQELNKRGVVSYRDSNSGNYSKNEIARFFRSEWCDALLLSIGSNFDGEYILSCLKKSDKIRKLKF